MINNKEIELTKDILLEEINTRKKHLTTINMLGKKKMSNARQFFSYKQAMKIIHNINILKSVNNS